MLAHNTAAPRRLSGTAWGTTAVAASTFALALPEGGFSTQLIAGVTVALWWTVGLGVLIRVLPREEPGRAAALAGGALAGLGALAALSMAWASDDGRVFIEVVRVGGYLGLFTLVVLFSRRGGARPWLAGLAIGLMAVAVVALLSRLVPAFPGGDGELVAAGVPLAPDRLSYPIGYWNGLAAAMALAAVLCAWFGGSARTRLGRATATALLALPILAIYLTGSRGGWLALAAGIATLFASAPRPALLVSSALGGCAGGAMVLLATACDDLVAGLQTTAAERQGLVILVALLLASAIAGAARYRLDARLERIRHPQIPFRKVAAGIVVGTALLIAVTGGPFERLREFREPPLDAGVRLGVGDRLASGGSSGRYQLWDSALEAFATDPLKGIGAGGYSAWWNQHGSLSIPVQNAHSLFVESLAELGLPGLLLALSFFGIAIREGISRRGPPGSHAPAALAVVVTGLTSAALEWTWELPGVFAPVVVAVALLTGPATLFGKALWIPVLDKGPPGPRALLPGMLLVAVVVAAAGALQFATQLELGNSRNAVRSGDVAAAADHARAAASLQPWASAPRLQLAVIEVRAGDLDAARAAVEEAIERAPEQWRPWAVKAAIEERSGRVAAAQDALARTRALLPSER